MPKVFSAEDCPTECPLRMRHLGPPRHVCAMDFLPWACQPWSKCKLRESPPDVPEQVRIVTEAEKARKAAERRDSLETED